MKYKTELEALLTAKKLWEHIAERGVTKIKAYTDLGLDDDLHDCPCCEFSKEDVAKICSKCPIKEWREIGEQDLLSPCTRFESPYASWRNCGEYYGVSSEYAKASARAMVELIKINIERIENEI